MGTRLRRGALLLAMALALPPAAAVAEAPGMPLPAPTAPRGTPLGTDAAGVARTVTTRSLRDACDALARQVAGKPAVRAEPLRKVRTTEYCRVLSLDVRTSWLAVHLYRVGRDGKTTYALIPRPGPAPDGSGTAGPVASPP